MKFQPYWNRIGTVLETYWNRIGTVFETNWKHIGIELEPYWNRIGTVLEPYWLEPYWNRHHNAPKFETHVLKTCVLHGRVSPPCETPVFQNTRS